MGRSVIKRTARKAAAKPKTRDINGVSLSHSGAASKQQKKSKVGADKRASRNPTGRPKGTPNKTTTDVRQAIALFAQDNAPKLQAWLDKVAEGIEPRFRKGKDGSDVVLYPGAQADPGRAIDLYLRAIEYHIPKLQRTEHDGLPSQGDTVIAIVSTDPQDAAREYLRLVTSTGNLPSGPKGQRTLEHAKKAA